MDKGAKLETNYALPSVTWPFLYFIFMRQHKYVPCMEDGGNAGGGMTVVQASHSSSESISQLGMEHGVVVVATRTRRARLSSCYRSQTKDGVAVVAVVALA